MRPKHKLTLVITEKLGWDHRNELIEAVFKVVELADGDVTQGTIETSCTKIEWHEEPV